MSNKVSTLRETVAEIESFSSTNGLDLAIDLDARDDQMMLTFTKTSEDIIKDAKLIEECKTFVSEVVLALFLRHEDNGRVHVDMCEDEYEPYIVYIEMTIPKSHYIVESLKTYVFLAHRIDSFLAL